MQWSRFDKVLFVRSVTIRRVVGVFTSTKPNCSVFFRDETKRGKALGFDFVGSVTKRLLLAVSTCAPRITLSTNELHFERLLRRDDGFWRKCGQTHLAGCLRWDPRLSEG